MDAGQAKPMAQPTGAPQHYELAFNVVLPALTKHAEQRALAFGLLDCTSISHCKLISLSGYYW